MIDRVDVAVIGAGISGLSAAFELHQRGRSFVVLESSDRPGGIVQTERIGELTIDAGPDSLLVQKPAALALCAQLGIAHRLVPTKKPRTAFVLRNDTLHPLPEASVLGFPTRLAPLVTSRLFSLRGKARMAAERFVPRRESAADESIAAFVRRRFGDEAVAYIAEPLLAGIHAGDVEKLSMRALFPRLVEAEARAGSVIKAFGGERRPATADGVFRSFPDGIREIVDALASALPPGSVHLQSRVSAVEPASEEAGYLVHVDQREPTRARSVVVAVPAFAAVELLSSIDAQLIASCRVIPYLSTATVVLAYHREAVGHPLNGTGFVVPRTEGKHITAAAWISSKWPHRAPERTALLRAFLGGARDPDVLARTDEQLINEACADLMPLLRLHGVPQLARVYRWKHSTPQQEVGHLDLMDRIDGALARHPGLFVSAAGFRGVGIPDCIADARRTAEAAARFVLQ